MITYILESIAFQLVFLLTYDLFLKKETFFQLNRGYLLATFALSLVLPWIKVEVLTTTIPEELGATTVYLTQLNGVVLGPEIAEQDFLASIPWPYWILGAGSFLATVWFAYKLIRIRQLRNKGLVQRFADFTKITVPQSSTAFSFFRNIFLGADIKKEKEENILAHELVHVKQFHSLDLIFFELARILFWFNPLVYVYQNRIAELHEFIADAHAVKHNKKDHFEMLLSEAFNTQNISFVNQFFNQSLIKKRIVMVQKKKSKAVWQLKYVLLLPMVFGMMVYTSCEKNVNTKEEMSNKLSLEERLTLLNEEIKSKDSLTAEEKNEIAKMAETMVHKINESAKKVDGWKVQAGTNLSSDTNIVPFAVVEEVPVFPGCENAEDKKVCFMENMQKHIQTHFKYPKEAQKLGLQGKVNVIFIVGVDGKIKDIRKRGPHEILEEETQRIIEELPQMQPGKSNGVPVEVPFSIPITFKL
jgi:TonB family protein